LKCRLIADSKGIKKEAAKTGGFFPLSSGEREKILSILLILSGCFSLLLFL
jgi:hypothetical protein